MALSVIYERQLLGIKILELIFRFIRDDFFTGSRKVNVITT